MQTQAIQMKMTAQSPDPMALAPDAAGYASSHGGAAGSQLDPLVTALDLAALREASRPRVTASAWR